MRCPQPSSGRPSKLKEAGWPVAAAPAGALLTARTLVPRGGACWAVTCETEVAWDRTISIGKGPFHSSTKHTNARPNACFGCVNRALSLSALCRKTLAHEMDLGSRSPHRLPHLGSPAGRADRSVFWFFASAIPMRATPCRHGAAPTGPRHGEVSCPIVVCKILRGRSARREEGEGGREGGRESLARVGPWQQIKP